MYGAESVKRDIWMNIETACGGEITVNRSYVAYLLKEMESSVYKTAYEQGYSQGYNHAILARDEQLPNDKDFKGCREDW